MDHYILFRDTSDPVSPIDYDVKFRTQDLSPGDKASYVWRDVGGLDARQAKIAKKNLDFEFEARFEREYKASVAHSGEFNEINIMPHHPSAWDFLAQLAPAGGYLVRLYHDKDFFTSIPSDRESLAKLPLNIDIRIQPESETEMQRILDALFSYSSQSIPFSFSYKPRRSEVSKQYRSFVELLSSQTLRDIWSRFDDAPNMDPLRRTAVIWFLETQCGNQFPPPSKTFNPEETELSFKASIDAQKSTPLQQDVLARCEEIVGSVRKASVALKTSKSASKSQDGDEERDKGKYEKSVKAMIEQRAEQVAEGEEEKLYTANEIVSFLKRAPEFKDIADGTLKKGVMRTTTWKKRKTILVNARKEAGLGKSFDEQRRDDKHQDGKNMAPWQDVNNEGDRDFD